MFSLVHFDEDDVLSVVPSTRLRRKVDGKITAPYGRFYFEANLLLVLEDKNILNHLKKNMENGLPIVRLERLNADSHGTNLAPGSELSSELDINSMNDSLYIPSPGCQLISSATESNKEFDITEEQFTNRIIFTPPSQMEKNRTFAANDDVPTVEEGSMKNYCLFCNKFVTKIVRHLSTVHSSEDAVKEFLHLPKRSKERKEKIRKIKNEANFRFNTKSNLFQKGRLIIRRRPRKIEGKKETNYLPCSNCKGFYSKKNLRNHFRVCTGRALISQRQTLALRRRSRCSLHVKACDLLRDKIFPVLREDEIIAQIRYDELLIVYANNLCMKFSSRPQCYSLIRDKIRKMAKFLNEMKKIDKDIACLADIFHPKHYDNIIQCVYKMGKFNNSTGELEAPSTGLDVGTQLKILCEVLHCEYIKQGNERRLKEVEQMSMLLKRGLSTSVNVNVKETQLNNVRKKKIILPSSDDISKLMIYLYTNREKYYKKLCRNFKLEYWTNLTKFTLLCIETFNRRRPGETERILIEDYKRKQKIDIETHPDIYKALKPEDVELAKKYSVFQLRGKRVKNVSVLINIEIEESIDLILKYRGRAKVPNTNPYVFGEPYSIRAEFDNRFYRVCPLLRSASIKCGAKNPQTLRNIQLRKHVATKAVLLHSKYGFQTKQLANFMGHHSQIHEDHYQISELSVQVTGIGRLLEHIQGPSMGSKSLDEESFVAGIDKEKQILQTDDSCDQSLDETFKSPPNKSKRAASPDPDFSLDSECSSNNSGLSEYHTQKKRRNRSSEDLGKEFIVRRSWSTPERTLTKKTF